MANRTIYVKREVGADCASCPERSKDFCRPFQEELFTRFVNHPVSGRATQEWKMLAECAEAPTSLGTVKR